MLVSLNIGDKLQVLREIFFFDTLKTVKPDSVLEVVKINEDKEYPYIVENKATGHRYNFHCHSYDTRNFDKRYKKIGV